LLLFSGQKKSWYDFKHKGDLYQASQEVMMEKECRLAAFIDFLAKNVPTINLYSERDETDCCRMTSHVPGDTPVIPSAYVYEVHNTTGFHTVTNSGSGPIHRRKNVKTKFQKLIKCIPWRLVIWVVVVGGVLGGCIAGTVLTAGVGAPLLVLIPAVVEWAEKDIKKHKRAAQ
jgi:hypothetical protein